MGWIIVVIGAVLAIVGTFLPWITAGTTVIPGYVQVGGIAIIIFGVLALVFSFMGRAGPRLSVIFGLLVALMAALTFVTPGLLASFTGATVTIEYGVWVSLAGGVIIMIGGWVAGMEAKKAAQQKAMAAGK